MKLTFHPIIFPLPSSIDFTEVRISASSVQAALCLFGQKSDLRRNWSTSNYELAKEKELEGLLKDLATIKVQFEAKDSAHKQALLNLDHYKNMADELSTLLRNTEFERDIYANECRESRMHLAKMESKMIEMADQLSETSRVREHLSHVISELRSAQGELLSIGTELAAASEAKRDAMTQAEMMETALNMEKEKIEELLSHVAELHETILHLNLAAIEAEKDKCALLYDKEAEIQLATEREIEAWEQLEYMGKQLEMMDNLENQLLAKSLFIDSLQLELQQANELHSSAERAAADAVTEINCLKADLDLQKSLNSDQTNHSDSLEIELNQVRLELNNANEEVQRLRCDLETMTSCLEKIKSEVDEISGREAEAQVEIALLQSELHKGRSKVAAAEAAEARAKNDKSAVYLALQQLALEAEEAKKENRKLKEQASTAAEESEKSVLVETEKEKSDEEEEVTKMEESISEGQEREDEADTHITISLEEYKTLVNKAAKADQVPEPVSEDRHELEMLKKDLDIATIRIGEFRTRAEQALSRAEVAETAKGALEGQIRRWREHRERRKAAFAALREELVSRESYSFKHDETPKKYQPLGKVLNMKF
ncbi:hypothetical protein RJ640_003314 [Escallonia rubra]|uniref:Uncharacterized protein n=1 Tax=Escallonia rubra TaxID=112253 RepID=A0AA88U8X8_9ASTE|nr:hypothetical protein RJ640_003314 [Escallonia rubra]